MMKIPTLKWTLAIAVLSALPLASSAVFAAEEPGNLAKSVFQSKAIAWVPQFAYRSVTLRVVGPGGFVHDRNFGSARPVFDLSGMPYLADGQYSFELVFGRIPDAGLAKAIARAQLEEDGSIAGGALAARIGALRETVSGAFTISQGQIVSPYLVEPAARTSKEYLSTTSPSIQSSLCVGLDCAASESFGFDTIRLKENNLRIGFADTSTGAFPANAWQLTANDSASGGANKFSIEDITGAKVPFTVTAGAASNSIFIDSTGRVGFRTSTPVLDLHARTGNTPGIRLEQDNSGGFTAQTWDMAANEANFFIRDVTGGSRLPFRIRPGAPTSSIDIAASGNVGIGTQAPISNGGGRELTVSGEAGFAALNLQTTTSPITAGVVRFYGPGTTLLGQIAGAVDGSMRFLTNGGAITERMRISPSGNVGVGTAAPNVGGAARALTIATPSGGTGDFAALELQGSQNADSASGAVRFYNKANLTAQIASGREGADNTASLRFLTANAGAISEKMRILPSGNVGIGTASPTAKLHVQGDVTVTGALHVSGPCCGPDYVFDSAYKLASIEDQAAYMWKNRHLPAVGAARTTSDGSAVVDVFSQSKGMLEELEKAHIYIEKLHREIQALRAEASERDARVRAELAALRKRLDN